MGIDTSIDISADQKIIILDLLNRYLPNTMVWVYGSRIKGTARPSSDLDMVTFTTTDQRTSVEDLKEAFEESDLPFRVDLFTWDEVPAQFHKNIKEVYVVIQSESKLIIPKPMT
jgi:type I restriction enzyme S subunit